nr:hypothetical protein [Streptomyces turgidiscabies]
MGRGVVAHQNGCQDGNAPVLADELGHLPSYPLQESCRHGPAVENLCSHYISQNS